MTQLSVYSAELLLQSHNTSARFNGLTALQGIFKQLAALEQTNVSSQNFTTQSLSSADLHNIVNTAISSQLSAAQQSDQAAHCEHAFNLVHTLYRQHQTELQRNQTTHSSAVGPDSNAFSPSMYAEHAEQHPAEHNVNTTGNQPEQQEAADVLTGGKAEGLPSPSVLAGAALDIVLPVDASQVESVPDTPVLGHLAESQGFGVASEAAEIPGKDPVASGLQELPPSSQVR